MEIERLETERQSDDVSFPVVSPGRQREGKESINKSGNKWRGCRKSKNEKENQNIERVRNFVIDGTNFYKITWFSKYTVSYYCLQENENNLFFTITGQLYMHQLPEKSTSGSQSLFIMQYYSKGKFVWHWKPMPFYQPLLPHQHPGILPRNSFI